MMLITKYQGSMHCGDRQEDFFRFSLYKFVKHVTFGRSHLWPQKHNLNKLSRDPVGDDTYQISRL